MSPITVIIEAPKNNPGKYVYDETDRCYKLKKILPLGMYFPYDFGFIEGTHAEDGDPADAMVFTEGITYPGIRLACRIIGALQAKQNKNGKTVRNDRYFVIPEDSIAFEHIKEINEFSKKHNQQLQDFFVNYNKAVNKRLMHLKFINSANAFRNLEKLMKWG